MRCCAMLGCRQAAHAQMTCKALFSATCTLKLVVELFFPLICDSRCRQLVDIDMKVWNDQLVADLFATSTLNYEGISCIQWPFD